MYYRRLNESIRNPSYTSIFRRTRPTKRYCHIPLLVYCGKRTAHSRALTVFNGEKLEQSERLLKASREEKKKKFYMNLQNEPPFLYEFYKERKNPVWSFYRFC